MNKIKIIAILFLSTFSLSNCKKKTCDTPTPSVVAGASEIATIQNHLAANGLTATQHSSGIFYSISNEGSGDAPTMCSNVSVQYTGKFLNGTIFDESKTTVTFQLLNLIVGWQIGIPLIKNSGLITLYIPPSLAYGSSTVNGIPGNSTLVFDIKLIASQSSN